MPSIPYGGNITSNIFFSCKIGVPTIKSEDVASAMAARSGRVLGGLRLRKGNEKSDTDVESLRAAHLKKYEAFHGVGQSLSGKRSTFKTVSNGAVLGSTGSIINKNKLINKNKSQESSTEDKSKILSFQGTGRRLR
jgi:hypothetical protein